VLWSFERLFVKGYAYYKSIFFPFESSFEVLIHLKKELLKVPVKVVRLEKTSDNYDGMGVRVSSLNRKYLEFLIRLNFDSG